MARPPALPAVGRCADAPGPARLAAAVAPARASGPGASEGFAAPAAAPDDRLRARTGSRCAARPLVRAGGPDSGVRAQHRRSLLDLDPDRADPPGAAPLRQR